MQNYPPPPPGGPPYDPYASDRALAQWAEARGYVLSPAADVRWYQAWYPFQYLFRLAQVGREIRAELDEALTYRKGAEGSAKVWVVEGFENDPIKEVTGDHRRLYAFVTSPKLAYRAAIRSKQGAGIVDDLGKGLDSLFSSPKPPGLLADPTFEAAYDVTAPTREEAVSAIPMPLRSQLVTARWRGILELRAGGMAAVFFDYGHFEPVSLDAVMSWVQSMLKSATSYAHPVAPPRR